MKKVSEALCITFTRLLDGNAALAREFTAESTQTLTFDEQTSNSVFRKKTLLFTSGDDSVFIGTSTGPPQKIGQVKQLHRFLKNRGGCPSVKWIGETNADILLDLT